MPGLLFHSDDSDHSLEILPSQIQLLLQIAMVDDEDILRKVRGII